MSGGHPIRGTRTRLRALGAPAGAAAGLGLGCAFILWADPTTPGGPSPLCPTKLLFGIDCPGCGGLRMMYSLLHGDLPAALRYNAVALVFVLLGAAALVAWAAGRWRGAAVWRRPRWTPMAIGVLLGVWFVVRNLPFAPFTSLRV
ncbi:DUF2752 domain-containing protein [Amycolatopsis nigrescens]|uniref:DUF2752 domain-containing protein n=1 Tax=Amycolatopsis nigrescens TaxID=381445 RepID=UPI000373BB99|nr:DUF2752 domain-containing protein [Amycolatopsis nigrescens]